jgi:hypothetical protein
VGLFTLLFSCLVFFWARGRRTGKSCLRGLGQAGTPPRAGRVASGVVLAFTPGVGAPECREKAAVVSLRRGLAHEQLFPSASWVKA